MDGSAAVANPEKPRSRSDAAQPDADVKPDAAAKPADDNGSSWRRKWKTNRCRIAPEAAAQNGAATAPAEGAMGMGMMGG